jgi:glycosyltransferase involved in cell wall biosynthesis
MNILIMTDYLPPGRLGGVGEVVAGYADAFRRMGHRVYILTTGSEQAGEAERGIYRSSPSLLQGVALNNLRAPRLIRELDIDLLYLQQASSTLFLPFMKRASRPAVLYTLHVSYAAEMREIRPYWLAGRRFRPALREYLEKWLTMPVHRLVDWMGLRSADAITVMSEAGGIGLERFRAPVYSVPNGCNIPDSSPPARLDESFLEFRRDKILIAFSGSFRTRKRLPALLLAMQILLQEQLPLALVVMGGGHGYDLAMENFARELGIENRVWFTGHIQQQEVLSFLGHSDIFCMTSTLEGMPVALLEAMALGLAVIGTRIPGTEDAISEEQTGLLVEPDDIDGLASAIRRLASDSALRARLGQAAAQQFVSRFSWDTIARQTLAAFAERQ